MKLNLKVRTVQDTLFDSIMLFMLLFFPALKGYVFKIITLIIPSVSGITAQTCFSIIVWVIVIISFIHVWLRRIQFKHIFVFLSLFVFAVAMFIVERFKPNTAYTQSRFITLCIYLMPAFFYGAVMRVNPTVKKIVYYLAIFTFFVSVIYLFYKNTQVEMHEDNMDFAYRVLPSVLVIISSIFDKTSIYRRLFRIVLSIVACVFLLMQGTRGPVLCAAVFLFLMCFKKIGAIKTLILFSCFAIFILFLFKSTLGNTLLLWTIDLFESIGVSVRFLEKFITGNITDGSGRSFIVETLMDILKKNPYKVRGLFADVAATVGLKDPNIHMEYAQGIYAHNIYVEFIFDFGIILGGILSLLVTFGIIKSYVKSRDLNVEFVAIFVTMGFVHLLISGSFLHSFYFFALIGLFFSSNINKTTNNLETQTRDKSKLNIAEINMFVNGSTGNIMLNIAKKAREQGHTVETYSTHVFSLKYKKLPKAPSGHKYYGNYIDNTIHFTLSHFFGKNGTHSRFSTYRLIRELENFQPDVLHLHNLHNFCINVPMMFKHIKKNNIKVVWTLHDSWAFTGHCAHFDMIGCEKWKTGCYDCPNHLSYPKSNKDTSKWQYAHKKKWFTGVKNMNLVTPSNWLASKVKESFLSKYPVQVINNGIDLSVFKPTQSNLREKYSLFNKKILLFVADSWGNKKGFDDVITLSKQLSEEYQIVIIGLNEEQIKTIPNNIIGLERTENVEELVKWYSVADVFVNTTKEENFPTVNIEALACGTPVITYKTGGSPEIIDETCGIVVKKGSIKDLKYAIDKACFKTPFARLDCINRAKLFDMDDKFNEYVKLYEKICKVD